MSRYLAQALRLFVYNRAGGCCEYCRIHERYRAKRHPFDHIYAQKHGGKSIEANLCLSCYYCNHYKGSDMASLDPETEAGVFLFHPRRDKWEDHFRLEGAQIIGLTPTGRATVFLLQMNHVERVKERARLIKLNRYPG